MFWKPLWSFLGAEAHCKHSQHWAYQGGSRLCTTGLNASHGRREQVQGCGGEDINVTKVTLPRRDVDLKESAARRLSRLKQPTRIIRQKALAVYRDLA